MSLHLQDWLKHLATVAMEVAPVIASNVVTPQSALISAVVTAIVSRIKGVDPTAASQVIQVLSNNDEYKEKFTQIEKIITDIISIVTEHPSN